MIHVLNSPSPAATAARAVTHKALSINGNRGRLIELAGEKTPQLELESSEGQEAGATVIAIGSSTPRRGRPRDVSSKPS